MKNVMKKVPGVIPQMLAALSLSASLAAAARPARAQSPVPPGEGAARKVGEYVNQFSSCNAGAYLDNFAIELQNDTEATGYIIAYAPGRADGGYGHRLLDVTKDYLVNTRGLEESRLRTVYGGPYKSRLEAATELWLVPAGAAPPKTRAYRAGDAAAFDGKFADYAAWDYSGEGEGMSWSSAGEVALAAFADALRAQPETVGYVVAYNGREAALGTWRRVAKRLSASLESMGVESGRVKIIHGGTEKSGEYEAEGIVKVQLWARARGAAPPVKEAAAERRPKAAQRLNTYADYFLSSEESAREVAGGLADVLREDEHLRAYLVVRLPSPPEEPLSPDDMPEVDLAALADKWKAGLLPKRGVSENRVVVITVPPGDEWQAGQIEVWVVPPGAAPPDPYEKADDGDTVDAAES